MNFKKLLKDKKGVFGLTAVQMFFATVLGIALLAFVIVIIMGSISDTTILSQSSADVINESVATVLNSTASSVATSTTKGFGGMVVSAVHNGTGGDLIPTTNYTVGTSGTIISTDILCTGVNGAVSPYYCGWTWLVSYDYNYDSDYQNNLDYVVGNTSTGVTGFFSNISPVYAILAILVIILVLVVLVRVVQSPSKEQGAVQL